MLDRQPRPGWATKWEGVAPPPSLIEPLTPRELEVMKAMAGGFPRQSIANALGITPNTIKFHLRNIYAKLGVVSRRQALKAYFGEGASLPPYRRQHTPENLENNIVSRLHSSR